MPAASLQDITALPLTGLRYGLADKLLRINTTQRFNPVAPMQVDALLVELERAEININQLFNVQHKTAALLEAIQNKTHVADLVWDLIESLRMIQADRNYPAELAHYLELLIREWQANIFPAQEMKALLNDLRHVSKDRTLELEITNAQRAILEGEAPLDINLATPEKQLVWAAHVLFLLYNPYMMYAWPLGRRKGIPNLVQTGLWKQLTSCHHVRYLRVLFGTHIFNLLRDSKIQLGWGAPGSWFFYNSTVSPAYINCDLLYAMLVGFDHARACAIHEIGHAVQTKGIPDFIQATQDPQELELKQYFLNCAEDNCVNRFTQAVGGVFGQDYGYSLNYWYTAIGDIGRRFARKEVVHLEDTPEERFKNLSFMVSRVFLGNNQLFPLTPEGWNSVMARPDWITGRDRNNPDSRLGPEASYQQLMDMCEEVEHYFPPLQDLAGGPDHYSALADAYAKKRFALIHEIWKLFAADIAHEILQKEKENLDDTKDRFQMEMNHSQPPPKKKEKEEEEEKDNSDNPAPPTQSDKNSDKQSEEDLPGDPPDESPPPDDSPGGDGEEGDDTSSGADGAAQDSPDDSGDQGDSEDQESGGESDPQQGTPPPSDPLQDKDKDQSEQKDQEEPGDPEGEEQAREEREMEGEPPEGAETKETPAEEKPAAEQEEVDQAESTETKESAPEEQETEGIDPAALEALMQKLLDQFKEQVTLKEDQDAEPQAIEDDEDPQAELIREVEEPEVKPNDGEEEAREEEAGTERGDAPGGDEFSKGVLEREYLPDEPLASIEELMSALRESEQQDAERKAAQDERRKPLFEEEEEKPKLRMEIPPAMNLDELANGNWEDFNQRIALHGPVISLMAAALSKLKRAQIKLIHKISKKHSLTPEGGDLRRFDQNAMQRLLMRLAKQEKFEKDDLNMFRKDGKVTAESRPTRVILIDGSRSMSMGSSPLPMDKAIQEAVIDYMASNIAGYDTFITMFGPKNPILLAQPGDALYEIGKRIEQVHGGLNTMTFLAPALIQVIEAVAYRKKFEEAYVGFTNFVIYSDGDIDDLKQSREIIQQIILHAPKSTFDFVLITTKHATPMDVLIRTMEVRNPVHEIGVVRGNAKRTFPMALTATYKLTHRLLNARSGFADPAFVRGAQFKRLLRLLTAP